MAKKKEKVNMELEYFEVTDLEALRNSREALGELQRAIIPFAEAIATRQRIWWDRVLESRGLTREGTSYTLKNSRIIVDQQQEEKGRE